MLTLEALRKKIGSAEDLRDIVRTMKTLSAVNIRHYEKAVQSVTEYYRTVEMALQVVLSKGPIEVLPSPGRGGEGVAAVVFGSDTGLCGGFNDRVIDYALGGMYGPGSPRGEKTVLCVGERAGALLEARGHRIDEFFTVPESLAGVTEMVQRMVTVLQERIEAEKTSNVTLFYNRLVSTAAYEPASSRLLPFDREWFENIASRKWPSRVIPTYTMNRDQLFTSIVGQYIFVSLYMSFAQSMASENAGRLAAMQLAERNIEDRLEELNSAYRNQRQSSITAELLDIVSGYEALGLDK